MKKFFEEFKKFIQRGNVIDLAVGVIIGGAFSKITSSLVNDIIMPLITAIFGLFGVKGGVAGMSLVLNGVDKYVMDQSTNKLVLNPEAILWNYGNFIQTVLDFLLIALVLFCIIKAINAAKDGLAVVVALNFPQNDIWTDSGKMNTFFELVDNTLDELSPYAKK